MIKASKDLESEKGEMKQMMMDIENAKRQLQLYYGIDNPTDKQVAMFILYHIVY